MTPLRLESEKIPQAGQRSLVRHEGRTVVIFNVNGQLHAIEDGCPHAGSALCTGRLDGHVIQCPAHGLRFDLRSGAMPGNSARRCASMRCGSAMVPTCWSCPPRIPNRPRATRSLRKTTTRKNMELFDLVLAGKIVNEPKQTFSLADAAEAHRALEARKTVGATVLVP